MYQSKTILELVPLISTSVATEAPNPHIWGQVAEVDLGGQEPPEPPDTSLGVVSPDNFCLTDVFASGPAALPQVLLAPENGLARNLRSHTARHPPWPVQSKFMGCFGKLEIFGMCIFLQECFLESLGIGSKSTFASPLLNVLHRRSLGEAPRSSSWRTESTVQSP